MFGEPGDVKLGAFCSSEPDAGSDVGAIRTRAVYDEAADAFDGAEDPQARDPGVAYG